MMKTVIVAALTLQLGGCASLGVEALPVAGATAGAAAGNFLGGLLRSPPPQTQVAITAPLGTNVRVREIHIQSK